METLYVVTAEWYAEYSSGVNLIGVFKTKEAADRAAQETDGVVHEVAPNTTVEIPIFDHYE